MGLLACSLSLTLSASLPPGDFRIGVESHERVVDRSTEQPANFLASCDEVSLHDQIMLFADQNRDEYFSLYHIVNLH